MIMNSRLLDKLSDKEKETTNREFLVYKLAMFLISFELTRLVTKIMKIKYTRLSLYF